MPRCEMCGKWPHCPWKTDPDIICSEYHQKHITNYDLIRAKSVEEMAEWIDHIQVDAYERGLMGAPVVDYPNIYSKWLDWLKQEASGEQCNTKEA